MKRSRHTVLGYFFHAAPWMTLPLLLGGAEGGCSAGDDDHPTCGAGACDHLAATDEAKLCADGSGVGRTVCAQKGDGTCFWDFPACPPPLATDASDCGCVPDMQWGPNGGLTATTESTSVSACLTYEHVVHSRQGSTDATCRKRLVGCGSGIRSGRDIVFFLALPDVQSALQAAPIVYGIDDRPTDGQVFRIQIGAAILDVGSSCGSQVGCVAIPSGVVQLVSVLRAIDDQELRACAADCDAGAGGCLP